MHDTIDTTIARQFDKLPPHSIESEQCLIASLMLCGGDKIAFSSTRSVVTREAFYLADHQVIFDCLCELHDSGLSIDMTTVRECLRRKNLYEEVGGDAGMAAILNRVPSHLHYAHYARIVCEKWKWRELIAISNDAIRSAYAPHAGADGVEVVDEALTTLAGRMAKTAQAGKIDAIHNLADVIPEVLRMRHTGDTRRIQTGLRGIDEVTGGLGFGLKHLIASLQYVGKSALIKHFMRSIALQGFPVGVISIEEDRQKIAANLLSMESGVTNNKIQFATAGPEEWDSVELAAETLMNLPIKIVDSSRSLSSVVAMSRLLAVKEGCRAIFVDHDHIIEGQMERGQSREQEIAKISKELKWLWKELDVVGVEACQLNRAMGRDRPNMEHLRDSGTLAQDADVVMMLHREDFWRRGEPGYKCDNILEVWMRKVKAGGSGMAPLIYEDHHYRISDAPMDSANLDGAF
jgi:replicative DNA helicase